MIKVLAACGNGMGSSMIIKMKIEKVLKDMGVEHKIQHSSVGEAKSQVNEFDIILVGKPFVGEFNSNGKAKVVGLVNLLSEDEIRDKVTEALNL